MNPMTNFKKIRILRLLIAPALVGLAALTVTPVLATPSCGVITEQLALGHFPDGSLDLMCNESNLYGWNLKMKVHGDSDLYVIRNTWPSGAHTGWHTHPGPSMITVISGELTAYDASDRSCTPHIYHAGETFTDVGCGDVHLIRNEGTVNAVVIAVQIVPAGQPRRIDEPAPGNCPVITCP